MTEHNAYEPHAPSTTHIPASLPPWARMLAEEADRRFRLASSDVPTALGMVHLVHPARADDLISEADFVRDDRLPYWADIWPSSVAFASHFPAAPESGGRALLELGCGLGLVSIAAHRAGWNVLATDYYEDALLFARLNSAISGAPPLETRMIDWRDLPADLPRFDLVVASDVLYEDRYAAMVAHVLDATMATGGSAIIADSGRTAVPLFLDACRALGLAETSRSQVPFTDGAIHQTITFHRLERPGN